MFALLNTHKSFTYHYRNFTRSKCHCHQRKIERSYRLCSPVSTLKPYHPLQSSCIFSTVIRINLKNELSFKIFHYSSTQNPRENCVPRLLLQDKSFRSIAVRSFYSASIHRDKTPLKPSSKVEETVQALKQDLKENEKPADASIVEKPKKSLRQKIIDEAVHYYHGFRLLFIDIRVSMRLGWRVLNGKSLTRREHRLLVRTVSDLFRLLPFSVFIIVPFMELLLPVAIKLFPGMLPSTFQTATEKEDKMKQSLKVKLEMAKFLQQTLDDMAVEAKGHKSEAAKEFHDFMLKVRTTGEQASNEEIMKFSKLFEDEITLDSLSRNQLTALCRVLEIQPIGTNNFLRFQLRMRLRSLAADDKVIQKEGIDSMTPAELQQACRARGMRAYGMAEDRLKAQLAQWLDLSLNEKVPPSLLLMSRALLLPDVIPTSDQLKATISSLPDTVVTQTKAAIGEREGIIDNKTKIEVIKEEVRKIREEQQELREELKEKQPVPEADMVDKAPVFTENTGIGLSTSVSNGQAEFEKKEEITSDTLEKLEDALDTLGKGKKKLLVEKEELNELKEELADYQEDVQDLEQVMRTVDKSKAEIKETKGAQLLFKKVNKMINKMDSVLKELGKEEQQLKKDLQSKEQLKDIESQEKSAELVSIEELISAFKQIQKVPDNSFVTQISEVLAKMDDDHDGSIRVDDVLKVVELVGKENVKLSQKQIDEIVELMNKEEIIEIEEKIEKVLEKEAQQRKSPIIDSQDKVTPSGFGIPFSTPVDKMEKKQL